MDIQTKYGKNKMAVRPIFGMRVMSVSGSALIGTSGERVRVMEGSVIMLRDGSYSIYETIEDALSALRQAIEKYGDDRRGELAAVRSLRNRIKGVADDLLDFHRLYEPGILDSVVAGFGYELAGASAEPKAKAREQTKAAASPTDKLGRRNPWRQLMLLAYVDKNLEDRIKQILRVKDKMTERLVAVAEHYRKCVLAAQAVKEMLGIALAHDDWKNIGSGSLLEQDRGRQIRAVEFCKYLLELVRPLDVAPFVVYGYLTVGDLNSAIGAIQADRFAVARERLGHVFSGSRIQLAHTKLERFRFEISLAAKLGKTVDAKFYSGRLTNFVLNLCQIDQVGLIVANRDLVGLAVEAAIVHLHAGNLITVDSHLDRAIRLL